eukprot:COSAG01_NODE_33018_length_571_cov_1.305085_1_plen_71_part_10
MLPLLLMPPPLLRPIYSLAGAALQHGGGYSYRMAPADGPLTEETFGKMALAFVGNSTLRWDGDRSTQVTFN